LSVKAVAGIVASTFVVALVMALVYGISCGNLVAVTMALGARDEVAVLP